MEKNTIAAGQKAGKNYVGGFGFEKGGLISKPKKKSYDKGGYVTSKETKQRKKGLASRS